MVRIDLALGVICFSMVTLPMKQNRLYNFYFSWQGLWMIAWCFCYCLSPTGTVSIIQAASGFPVLGVLKHKNSVPSVYCHI